MITQPRMLKFWVHLASGVSSDKTIDALYAFTDCEVSLSPNACIIENDKPHFIGVSEILKRSADSTKALLKLELEIRKSELEEQWHFFFAGKKYLSKNAFTRIKNSRIRKTWIRLLRISINVLSHGNQS